MVPPDQFIPILESDPLFPELGDWILRESVLAAKQILNQYPGFVINVNLSYSQLEKPGFVDRVLTILKEAGYPPEHLCLEVTERCRLLDLQLLKNAVINFKSRGVQVALDDFGTGFSSIGIIKEIPFDIIKIDRSFVTKIEASKIDRQLIGNIAGLAFICGAKVCAEGIETAGMRDILKNYHVESFQGYYYAKPLLLEQFLEWRGCCTAPSIKWSIHLIEINAFSSRPCGTPGRKRRKESIFALAGQALLRKNAPRTAHVAAADCTWRGCGPSKPPGDFRFPGIHCCAFFYEIQYTCIQRGYYRLASATSP